MEFRKMVMITLYVRQQETQMYRTVFWTLLERVWRKGNPLTLLVGMQTSTATMEKSVGIP